MAEDDFERFEREQNARKRKAARCNPEDERDHRESRAADDARAAARPTTHNHNASIRSSPR